MSASPRARGAEAPLVSVRTGVRTGTIALVGSVTDKPGPSAGRRWSAADFDTGSYRPTPYPSRIGAEPRSDGTRRGKDTTPTYLRFATLGCARRSGSGRPTQVLETDA